MTITSTSQIIRLLNEISEDLKLSSEQKIDFIFSILNDVKFLVRISKYLQQHFNTSYKKCVEAALVTIPFDSMQRRLSKIKTGLEEEKLKHLLYNHKSRLLNIFSNRFKTKIIIVENCFDLKNVKMLVDSNQFDIIKIKNLNDQKFRGQLRNTFIELMFVKETKSLYQNYEWILQNDPFIHIIVISRNPKIGLNENNRISICLNGISNNFHWHLIESLIRSRLNVIHMVHNLIIESDQVVNNHKSTDYQNSCEEMISYLTHLFSGTHYDVDNFFMSLKKSVGIDFYISGVFSSLPQIFNSTSKELLTVPIRKVIVKTIMAKSNNSFYCEIKKKNNSDWINFRNLQESDLPDELIFKSLDNLIKTG